MDKDRQPRSWPLIAGIAGAAALAGFGAAYLLVPRAAPAPGRGAESAPAVATEVRIPAVYLASAGIVVEPVRTGSVGTEILAPASMASVPGGEAVVVARAPGTVTRITKRLGDPVRAGEVLALVDSLEAAGMAADRRVTDARAVLSRKTYDREADLFRQGVTPRQNVEVAESALAVAEAEAKRAASVAQTAHVAGNGRAIAVVSPIAGRITAASATLGSYVAPEGELFRIAQPGALQVEAAITPADAHRILPGDAASIVPVAGDPVPATVRSITPTVSGASQTATIVLVPASGGGRLIAGEGVQVRIHARAAGTPGLAVPEEAVQNLDGRDILFVRTHDGFRAQPVLVGARGGGTAQILSGISAGTPIAIRNAFLVKAEMNKGTDEE